MLKAGKSMTKLQAGSEKRCRLFRIGAFGASLSRLTGEAHKAVKDFCDHFSWDPSLSGMDDSHRFRQEHSKRFHSDVATGTATQGLKYAAFRGRLGEENHRGMGEAPANRGQQ